MPSRWLVPIVLVALLVGGAVALAIGAGVGSNRNDTKTVVVNAGGLGKAAALPAAVTSKATALRGSSFDPARIYAQRSPGVVTIYSFFGDPDSQSTQEAQGSGFVISRKGYVLTNSHVITTAGESGPVRAAPSVYVEFGDRDRVVAKVVGWDVYDDVGLLKLDPHDHVLQPVPLGNSSAVVVGEPVAAIGSPLGNEGSLAVGVVSAARRSIQSLTAGEYNLVDAIQTDAPITHGNSGGPLFDARGRVVGINAQIRSQSGTGNDSGVGFAVPIDSAKRSVAQLVAKGHVAYAYVGITTQDVTAAVARALGFSVERGALVDEVKSGSPGARAGLRGGSMRRRVLGVPVRVGGDVILAIDGYPVTGANDVVRLVSARLRPGEIATFTILRAGKRSTVAVTMGARPAG